MVGTNIAIIKRVDCIFIFFAYFYSCFSGIHEYEAFIDLALSFGSIADLKLYCLQKQNVSNGLEYINSEEEKALKMSPESSHLA